MILYCQYFITLNYRYSNYVQYMITEKFAKLSETLSM